MNKQHIKIYIYLTQKKIKKKKKKRKNIILKIYWIKGYLAELSKAHSIEGNSCSSYNPQNWKSYLLYPIHISLYLTNLSFVASF